MKPVTLHKPKVNQETVDTLEELLQMAKEGELQSIMFVEMHSNNDIAHGWTGKPSKAMIGETEDMKFNILSQAYFPIMED